MEGQYVYIRSEPGLWTVGFYDPTGKWQPESDHNDRDEAAKRVAWLNGSTEMDQSARIRELEETVAFFASVIKSGEPWTEQCEQALNKATNGSVIREG